MLDALRLERAACVLSPFMDALHAFSAVYLWLDLCTFLHDKDLYGAHLWIYMTLGSRVTHKQRIAMLPMSYATSKFACDWHVSEEQLISQMILEFARHVIYARLEQSEKLLSPCSGSWLLESVDGSTFTSTNPQPIVQFAPHSSERNSDIDVWGGWTFFGLLLNDQKQGRRNFKNWECLIFSLDPGPVMLKLAKADICDRELETGLLSPVSWGETIEEPH